MKCHVFCWQEGEKKIKEAQDEEERKKREEEAKNEVKEDVEEDDEDDDDAADAADAPETGEEVSASGFQGRGGGKSQKTASRVFEIELHFSPLLSMSTFICPPVYLCSNRVRMALLPDSWYSLCAKAWFKAFESCRRQ